MYRVMSLYEPSLPKKCNTVQFLLKCRYIGFNLFYFKFNYFTFALPYFLPLPYFTLVGSSTGMTYRQYNSVSLAAVCSMTALRNYKVYVALFYSPVPSIGVLFSTVPSIDD